MLQAIPYHLGAFFTRFAPKWVCRGITWTLAKANILLRPATLRMLRANFAVMHPEWSDAERRVMARRVIERFADSILLFLELPFLEPDDIMARCDVDDLRTQIDGLGAGQGFIIVTAHIGPWELGGYCLRQLGHVVNTVALDHPSRAVTKFFSDRRDYIGIRAHPLGGSFAELKEAVERGECVALLIDRAYGRARKPVRFFGVEKDFPLGHLILASRTGAPILTGALLFDGKDRFRYVRGGTYWPDPTLDEFDKLDALQECCVRDLERIIHAHSEQWFHFFPLVGGKEHGGGEHRH
ncbi:MAG TPA: lysophospholipid acyltransferase family protein [Candidatus Krumholzibacteria bacterium]|nr:lysophospholipid acyltransferase family protein [Candidatus Krumholzibacteria bacterium]